ncbi:MAG: type I-E CRISPR-associated protein Cas6/Cse3/CasE [Bacillota bacterium]|jgi:CRISPR system Cascade subunit CasE|nr:type I-E CRISPR-associated protein Cas6/Cse3/CasE [Bacillota bacterium]NLP22289.1 type I-E CRISPR-associated protein Cas6/Cse3/CasE [Erysipelotrichaceae bacterium]
MYLSRVEIDIKNRRKIKNLSHVGAFHNWVENSFPKEIKFKQRSRKLWRIDKLNGKEYLLIVSSEKPDIQILEKYGVQDSAETKYYGDFLGKLKNGQKMKFRVVLNPVISIPQRNGERGIVKPHVTIEYQMKYLLDRSEKNGFIINKEEVNIVERGYVEFKKPKNKSIRLVKVVYEGILTIKDVDIFRNILINGIGKKKAYGFGMITVIPVI